MVSESVAQTRRDALLGAAALRALIDHAPDAIFVADAEGRYLYVNDAGCEMLGYTRDELLEQRIQDAVPAADLERLARAQAAMLEGTTGATEWTLRHKDGSLLPVEVTARILPDGQWQGFVRDISERRALQAEREALFQQADADRRQLQTLVDTLPLAVMLYQPDGTIVANRRCEELLGMSVFPAAGSTQYADRIFFADGKPVPREQLMSSRVLRGQTVIAEEFMVRHPDGSELPVLASAAPITDGDRRIIGGVGVFQDMSERMRLERKVRDNEHLLKSVFELLPVGIWIADAAGRISSHNPAAERIWGGAPHPAAEQFGQFHGWFVDTGKPIAPDEWAMARAVRNGETCIGELVRIQCFDGSFKTIIHSAAPLRGEDGLVTGGIVLNEDITALHQTQEQLRAAVRDREQILALVTHDLRSPLSAFRTLAATVALKAQKLPGGEPVRAMADNMMEMARQMSGLVNDLLSVAVVRTGGAMLKLVPTGASSLLENAARSARPLFAREGIRFGVQVRGELPVVHIDPDRILRVFANLLDNARKFTDRGGEVVLRAEALSAGVRYCVTNSGPPLAPKEMEAMFQPFWQAGRGDLRGAGLGLAICRAIVEAHGGSIWAEAAAGQRVRVCFLLPCAPTAVPRA